MDYPTWDPASKNTPLGEDELQALDETLQTLPADGAMSLDGLDGYLTALLVGPSGLRRMNTADWLPAVWGGDPAPGTSAPFASNQKKKRTTVLLLRHLQSLYVQLKEDPGHWEPIFSVADQGGPEGGELADATEWCLGFLQATDLAPFEWGALFDDAELGPHLAPIRLLGEGAGDDIPDGDDEDDEPADLDDPVVRDELSRAAAEAVIALLDRGGNAVRGEPAAP